MMIRRQAGFRLQRLVLGSGLMALLCLAFSSVAGARDGKLPKLGIVIETTTVSGLSSGGYMAGQFQLAHGDIVTGAGIVAAGPYGCAEDGLLPNIWTALFGCMQTWLGSPNPERLARAADLLAQAGDIAPISKTRGDRVFLFTGRKDVTVRPRVVRAARNFYRALGLKGDAVVMRDDIGAGHGFPTETKGAACGETQPPYIVDCDYDLAQDLLAHLLGPLNPAKPTSKTAPLIGFAQARYLAKGVQLADTGLDERGLVFVPENCRTAPGCRAHVVFHGCWQGIGEVGETFARDSGYLRWAAANRLVLLFPQIAPSRENPRGCWDWWGYTGGNYLKRSAPQMSAVRLMLTELANLPERVPAEPQN